MRKNITRLLASVGAAALIGGGALAASATSASATTTSPAVTMAAHSPNQLNGFNRLKLVYGSTTYTYTVNFHSQWVSPGVEVISGTLRDTYEPVAINLPIHGVQFGNVVVFSVAYPTVGLDAGDQGVRTFSGTIHGGFPFGGHLTGSWTETGLEGGSGTFSLQFPV